MALIIAGACSHTGPNGSAAHGGWQARIDLHDLGREGGGPGEYKQPDGLTVLPDGRVLVRDPGNARITVYSPMGDFLEDWRHPAGGGFNTDRRFYTDTAGNSGGQDSGRTIRPTPIALPRTAGLRRLRAGRPLPRPR